MFTNIEDLLKFLSGKQQSKADFSGWPQIAQLTPQEKLEHKNLVNGNTQRRREIELHIKKIEMLDAQSVVERDEFWNNLYKSHGLPQGANYHIADDGRILMEPKAKA